MKPDVGGDAEAPAGMGPPAEEGTALQTEGEQQGHGRGGGGGRAWGLLSLLLFSPPLAEDQIYPLLYERKPK